MDIKTVIAAAAFILAIYNYGHYIRDILKGKFKPHGFSWFIWAFLTLTVFAAQMHEEAGAGALATFVSGAVCLIIAGLALKYGEKHITKTDWTAFILAFCAIPLWLVTENPLYAVILVTLIDIVGFWPTLRKSWLRPHQESMRIFLIAGLIFAMSVAAFDVYNLTTCLYPLALVAMNWGFVIMLYVRRKGQPPEIVM